MRRQEELVNKIIEEHIKFMNKVFEHAMKEFEDAVKKGEGVYDGYILSVKIENGRPYVKYYRISNMPFDEELKEKTKGTAKVATQA